MVSFPTSAKRLWRPRNLIVTACLLAVAIGIGTHLLRRGVIPAEASRGQPSAVPVTVAAASRRDVPIHLTGLGTVQATFTVGIHSQVDGKLQDVFFKEGQRVKKGDVLAKIDPRLFQAALDQAKAKKAQDEAQLVSFQKDLARFQTLGAKGFETQQNLDQQQAKVDTAKASIAADEAAIETAQTQLDYTDIKATSDGRMGVRMVDPGNIVHATDARIDRSPGAGAACCCAVHAAGANTRRRARGAEARRGPGGRLRPGQPPGTQHRHAATIDNVIDQTTASYRLKATFPTRTRSCGRANSSTPGCWSRPSKTFSSCPTPPSSAVPRASSSGSSPKRTPQHPSRSRSAHRSATSPSSLRASMTASASSPAGNTSCGPMSPVSITSKPQSEENGVS